MVSGVLPASKVKQKNKVLVIQNSPHPDPLQQFERELMQFAKILGIFSKKRF